MEVVAGVTGGDLVQQALHRGPEYFAGPIPSPCSATNGSVHPGSKVRWESSSDTRSKLRTAHPGAESARGAGGNGGACISTSCRQSDDWRRV